MPDIAMCRQHDCPKAQECYRFLATPDEHRQSYLVKQDFGEQGCGFFWEANGRWTVEEFTDEHQLNSEEGR